MNSPNCLEMENALIKRFNIRQCMVVPNVSWGAGIHECDMLVLTRSGYAYEVEIKISKADLKKDATKPHGHNSRKIRLLFFAIPEHLLESIDLIPERAGIIVIKKHDKEALGYYAELIREATMNTLAVKWTAQERLNLGRLGCMRIWKLKRGVMSLKNDLKNLREQIKQQHEK